jgi:hypothetical protein
MNASPQQLNRVFASWSAVSLVSGAALWATGRHQPARHFGRQTFAWGVVNAAIAGWAASRPAPEVERLRRILKVNALADVGYIAVGALMYQAGRRPDGAAVIVQGSFLLALDSHFAYHLPREEVR